MRYLAIPFLATLISCSGGPTSSETTPEPQSGCTKQRAFKSARSQMYINLAHPESSVIDTLEQAFFHASGDTTMVTVHALASNSFGVKDDVSLTAAFICRNDSLFWVYGMIGGSLLDIEGRPVDDVAGYDWDRARHEQRMNDLRK